jgi:hypothetical protein
MSEDVGSVVDDAAVETISVVSSLVVSRPNGLTSGWGRASLLAGRRRFAEEAAQQRTSQADWSEDPNAEDCVTLGVGVAGKILQLGLRSALPIHVPTAGAGAARTTPLRYPKSS